MVKTYISKLDHILVNAELTGRRVYNVVDGEGVRSVVPEGMFESLYKELTWHDRQILKQTPEEFAISMIGSPGNEPAPYGYCPQCGARGMFRERRLGGNDKCENDHEYPSSSAMEYPPITATV